MGRKSRLKWERRKQDGWCTPVGRLGAYYLALATGVQMASPTPLIQEPTAAEKDHPKGGHDEAVGRGESPDASV